MKYFGRGYRTSYDFERRAGRYSPAKQVGSGVRSRITALLEQHPVFVDIHSKASSILEPPLDKSAMLAKLAHLREQLEKFEKEIAGIGHNQPPEPIDMGRPRREDVQQARANVDALTAAVEGQASNSAIIEEHAKGLANFGLKLTVWLGRRATKFIDAALVTAAPIAVATATNLLPALLDVVSHLGPLLGIN